MRTISSGPLRGAALALAFAFGAGLVGCADGKEASAPGPLVEEPTSAELGLAGQPGPRDSTLKQGVPGMHPPVPAAIDPGKGAPPGMKSISCAEAAGRWDCTFVRNDGLTILQSTAFLDAAGVPSPRPTDKTVAQSNRMSVKGTTSEPLKLDGGAGGTIQRTIDERGEHTVNGMQKGSTTRTVNGWREGTSAQVRTTPERVVKTSIVYADTTRGLIHSIEKREPAVAGQKLPPIFPLSGSVVRYSTTTTSTEGKPAEMHTLRELITYDGSSVAKVVITHNGVTKHCTRDLATGKMACQ
jgi:hypothetical protein